ncbi:MAG: hypothetical protein ACR2LK_12425 [Solirubrobacteraceae bacterium]
MRVSFSDSRGPARRLMALLFALTLAALLVLPAHAQTQDQAAETSPLASPIDEEEESETSITPAAERLRRRVEIGISDQKADLFSDPRFEELGLRNARLTISWDVLHRSWEVEELDHWLKEAREAGVKPLLTIGHSRAKRRLLPSPRRLRLEFRRLRKRYPSVDTYATWNEANHCGEPTCHRPKLAALYYRALRRECPRCTIIAPELLDLPNAVGWVKAFRRKLGFTPKRWGLHNYIEINRFRTTRLRRLLRALPGADIWLTETGGLVRRDNNSKTDIPEGSVHAGEVTRFIFDRLLPALPRIKAVYLYHWNAGPRDTTWDSGLINSRGGERAAFYVLRRVLAQGSRPDLNYRSPRRSRARKR